MTHLQLQEILQSGENSKIEFKASKEKLNKDAFDSICAFLNRSGGHLILGVNDKKEVIGVDENSIQKILDTLVVNANNPQKLNPPYYLSPYVLEIGWVDELGSGVRNTYKYCELFTSETSPIFIEGDTFKSIVPLVKKTTQVALKLKVKQYQRELYSY